MDRGAMGALAEPRRTTMLTFRAKIMTVAAVTALIVLGTVATPVHAANSECSDLTKDFQDKMKAASKSFLGTMADMVRYAAEPDGAEKTLAQRNVCQSANELLSIARTSRSLSKTCELGKKELATIEKGIKKIQSGVAQACSL
jgi:hypothetical protein